MNNRPSSFPILKVLSFVFIFSALVRAADPAVPDSASTTNVSPTAPAATAVPAEAPPAATTPETAPTERPTTYTVMTGDTLWDLSHKFNTSIKKLKKLNHLKKDHLKPGQVLKIPPAKTEGTPAESTPAKKSTKLSHKAKSVTMNARRAEPVQDFDVPASTFASCPEPPAVMEKEVEPAAETPEAPAPLAENEPAPSTVLAPTYHTPSGPWAAPSELLAAPDHSQIALSHSRTSHKDSAQEIPIPIAPEITSTQPAPKPANHGFFNFFYTPPPSVDWGTRFTQVARNLGDRGLEYDEDWRPPGEAHSWSMDCSNTTRYIYRVTTGIQLPRTASDQYYYLHLQKKAWDVPQAASGFADCNYLRQNLKPGDLLFWENTYKPERQPPITHVMIFLGTNARGQWIMAGSQSTRGGEHNRRHGGPDIYVFNPTRPCGGYSTWLGLVHHQGRFCAYGRPLEADKSKLSMAADD